MKTVYSHSPTSLVADLVPDGAARGLHGGHWVTAVHGGSQWFGSDTTVALVVLTVSLNVVLLIAMLEVSKLLEWT